MKNLTCKSKLMVLSVKLTPWITKFKEIWAQIGRYVFFGCAFALAVLAYCLTDCPFRINLIALAVSWITYFRLPYADNYIYSPPVRLGWGCVEYALVMTLCHCLCWHWEEMDSYIIGIAAAIFVSQALYGWIIPIVSKALGFRHEREYSTSGIAFIVYLIMLAATVCYEHWQQNNILFEQEEFVPVTSWQSEVINGTTHYIVKCSKGRFAISVTEFPQIRDVNSKTQIRVLKEKGGVKRNGADDYCRLEIKNR